MWVPSRLPFSRYSQVDYNFLLYSHVYLYLFLFKLFRCEDIDECHEGEIINSVAYSRFRAQNNQPKLCHGHCENTLGSYKCTCPHGYILESGHHCVGESRLCY